MNDIFATALIIAAFLNIAALGYNLVLGKFQNAAMFSAVASSNIITFFLLY